MSSWQVRPEGAAAPLPVASAEAVVAGLRDGIWMPTDDVKGPTDTAWTTIEAHPAFEEAAADLEPPAPEPADETNLDMNPLIDVCLVLLIFFILTISYASLERAIDVPEDTPEKGASAKKVEYKDIKDRVFRVTARMEGETLVVLVEKEPAKLDEIETKIKKVIDQTGRREMLLDIDGNVPWGVQTAILDAAKGNGVHNILYRPKPKR